MEIITLGDKGRKDMKTMLVDTCISFCHSQKTCSRCPLRHPVCRKVNKYTLITEWSLGDLREAVRIIGDSN